MLLSITLPLAGSLHDVFARWASHFSMPLQDHYYFWKTIGMIGMVIFGSRTFVQWIYSERHKEVKIPVIYWWLSVVGTILCLAYALRQRDSVFILMYLCNLIPYTRNLMLIWKKHRKSTDALESADAGSGLQAMAVAK